MLNEQDIKAAVIGRIRARAGRENAVLINEMVFGSNSRRADLVVANGHLVAFEIKSDLDTLRRLDGQVSDYLARFDKLVLVVSSKFLKCALDFDERVGVWESFRNEKGVVKIRVVRPGRLKSITSRDNLCEFLLKRELVDLIRNETGAIGCGSLSREALEGLSKNISVSKIRTYVIDSIKFRYRDLSGGFFSSCAVTVKPKDLEKLSRSKIKRKNLELSLPGFSRSSKPFEKREINLSRFFPAGDIPESIPRFVLVPLTA